MSLSVLAQHSDRVNNAIVSDGVREWDWLELSQEIQTWMAFIEQADADIVAYQLPNGIEWVALNLALLELKRTAVPIPHFFTPAQAERIIADSGADLFVAPRIAESETPHFRDCGVRKVHGDRPTSLPRGTGIVTYTSGSTGDPKGVCLSWDTLIETALAIKNELTTTSLQRHLCILPLSLLLENVAGLFANLLNGSVIFVPPGEAIGLIGSSEIDLPKLLAALAQYQPNSIILVPALLVGLTTAAEQGFPVGGDLTFAAVGGASTPRSLLDRARALGIPAYEGYGLTECGSVLAMNTPGHDKPGTAGRLLSHVRGQIVDGELVIAHPQLLGFTQGIHPARTEFKTGDLIDLDDDSFLTIRGRRRNAFITAFGRNVSPEWIESELTAQIEIQFAAVFGEASPVNAALIVPRQGYAQSQVSAAIARANAQLPDYAQISNWLEISRNELLRANAITANGRLRRTEIESAFAPQIESLLTETAQPATRLESN